MKAVSFKTVTVILSLMVVVVFTASGATTFADDQSVAADPDKSSAKGKGPAPVVRIVFIDKENCCKCTRERTEKSWAALQEALEGKSIPVERVHVDTQATEAGKYRKIKPMVAIPAGLRSVLATPSPPIR